MIDPARWIAVWLLIIMYLETVLRISTEGQFLEWGLLFSSLFGCVIILLVNGMIFAIKNAKTKRILNRALLFITCFLFASQVVYFHMMRTFYTVYSAGNAVEVIEFFKEAMQGVKNNWLVVLLMFIPFFASWTKMLPRHGDGRLTLKQTLLIVLAAVVLQISTIGIVNIGERVENSPYSLYYTMHYPEFSVRNLGLLTYMRLDAQRVILGWSPELKEISIHETIEIYELQSELQTETQVELETELKTELETELETETTTVKPIYNVLPIDFDALIKGETDETLLDMHQYFKSVEPTSRNAYTGKYKDYNLIFITAEGLSHLAIRQDVTPTLYKMAHEGIQFTNFYTALWGVSTTDGEYVATTGLIPKSGVWSYRQSRNNTMPFALGNQLKNLGYLTKAYHNHTYTYYDRDLTHPNMGYDYKGVGNGLEIAETWPESDLEMIEVTTPEYINAQHFHTYYMTVSGHMYYNFKDNFIASKNHQDVAELPYSNEVRAYLATQIELDRAMSHLLTRLELAGQLDNTLIAISADHYPYGLSQDALEALNGGVIEKNFELYRNAFILYTPSMIPEIVDKPASSLDILPTLSNLLGLEFDSRLMTGRDLFSDKEPLVILGNRSFITDIGKYNSATTEFIPNEQAKVMDTEALNAYRREISNEINAKFYYAAKILEQNYYEKVLE